MVFFFPKTFTIFFPLAGLPKSSFGPWAGSTFLGAPWS
jgi:hypothetical protein